MKESALQREVRLALSAPGQVFWRNNIGQAEFWNDRRDDCDRVAYGVGGPGGSDLLGIVGGRWVARELKAPGARTHPKRAVLQEQFRQVVQGARSRRHFNAAAEIGFSVGIPFLTEAEAA